MFSKELDDLFGIKSPEKKNEILSIATEDSVSTSRPSVDLEEEELEPEVMKDPEDTEIKDPDPFASMLDSLLESEGVDVSLEKRKKYNPVKGNPNQHDWASARESLYSDEAYQFRCRRCLKWVNVRRDQTLIDACNENDIDLNCGSQVMADIMNS